MEVDANGFAYVADFNNNRVRRIVLTTGAVTTLAGSGTAGWTDGTGTSAAFWQPLYVALDGLGNLYVTDWGSHRIRKVVLATQAVTTVAGTGSAGSANGVGVASAFNRPYGIECDSNGNAYVADSENHRIRKIVLSSATVTTLAGSGAPSAANGVGAAAGFNRPVNVVVDSSGMLLFVADYYSRMIRQVVIATQTVTTLAGSGTSGSVNGIGIAAQFTSLEGLAIDASGKLLFVGESLSNLIRQIVIATQNVTTIVGSGFAAWADGFGTNAAINKAYGLATDAFGNLYETDGPNQRVRVVQPSVPCPAGVHCAPGTVAPVPCTSGYFCALGADRVLCAQGYYCPSGSSAQVVCPAGAFHCAAGASAPVSIACAAGYDSDLTACISSCMYRFACLVFHHDDFDLDRPQARSGAGRHHVRQLHAGILLCGGLAECVWRHQYHWYVGLKLLEKVAIAFQAALSLLCLVHFCIMLQALTMFESAHLPVLVLHRLRIVSV